jgi:hypothetical protein
MYIIRIGSSYTYIKERKIVKPIAQYSHQYGVTLKGLQKLVQSQNNPEQFFGYINSLSQA